jgi:hypothetical protein
MVFLDACRQPLIWPELCSSDCHKIRSLCNEVTSVTTVGGLDNIYMQYTCVDSLLQSTD